MNLTTHHAALRAQYHISNIRYKLKSSNDKSDILSDMTGISIKEIERNEVQDEQIPINGLVCYLNTGIKGVICKRILSYSLGL